MDLFGNLDVAILSEYAVTYGTRFGGALVFLLFGWMVAGWMGRLVARRLDAIQFDRTLGLFFSGAARWMVLIAVFVTCFGIFGIPMTTFAAVIGAAGLAIGLALQGTLSHFASGVMLLIFRPFKVGDAVSAGGVTGKVQEIQLFTTVFDTPDNRRMFVPNSLIFGRVIENITYHDKRRVDVAVGCDYSADIDTTRGVLERAAASVPGTLEDSTAQILLSELGASSVDWIVRVWAPTPDYWVVREATIRAVKMHLDEAGIGIPFPQMDVHLDGGLEDVAS